MNGINYQFHKNIVPVPCFSWWQWWSDWEDVCIFDYGNSGHLLQARRNRAGKCNFRVANMKSLFSVNACVGDVIRGLDNGGRNGMG